MEYLQIRHFAKVRLQKMKGYLQIRPFAKVRLQKMKGYLQIHPFAIKYDILTYCNTLAKGCIYIKVIIMKKISYLKLWKIYRNIILMTIKLMKQNSTSKCFLLEKGKCLNFKVSFLDMYILQIRPFAIRRFSLSLYITSTAKLSHTLISIESLQHLPSPEKSDTDLLPYHLKCIFAPK